MRKLIEHVRPLPSARVVAFHSFGGSLYGDLHYDTQSLFNVFKPECLLALSMNGAPLPVEYGAPLRLRVETELGVGYRLRTEISGWTGSRVSVRDDYCRQG
ncbi:MAG: molybdopterin-dependent oxidoreductase [Acidobacteriota bacterium]|nr:molybdopterin-dependent oxidoreductase [Acidobacteriota bacterium]